MDAKTRLNYERRVRELTGPGHRGSTTDGERRGADYLAAELRTLGQEPDWEPFAASPFLGARLRCPNYWLKSNRGEPKQSQKINDLP